MRGSPTKYRVELRSPGQPVRYRWVGHLGSVRDLVRQELVARQLAEHLPQPAAGPVLRVLDVGCRQGTQAIRLARLG